MYEQRIRPDYLLLLCIVLKFIFFYILEFNGFQPILKYRHYTPKLKPNELTDHDIQIMNLPFKQKKTFIAIQGVRCTNTYHYR